MTTLCGLLKQDVREWEMSDSKTWGDDESRAFEVWKYYGAVGGADKDRMVQIVTWLLGFSAAIIGFYANGGLSRPLGTLLLFVLGALISLLAAYVALLYGSYAAWNWSIADRIARRYEWTEQMPDFVPFEGVEKVEKLPYVKRLAEPAEGRIAPVFKVFFCFSLASFLVHAFLMVNAVRHLAVCG